MYAKLGDDSISVLDPTLVNLSAYRAAALHGLPVHRVEPRKPSGRKAPSCADQIKAVAIDLYPEWADAIRAVGVSSSFEAGVAHVH